MAWDVSNELPCRAKSCTNNVARGVTELQSCNQICLRSKKSVCIRKIEEKK